MKILFLYTTYIHPTFIKLQLFKIPLNYDFIGHLIRRQLKLSIFHSIQLTLINQF